MHQVNISVMVEKLFFFFVIFSKVQNHKKLIVVAPQRFLRDSSVLHTSMEVIWVLRNAPRSIIFVYQCLHRTFPDHLAFCRQQASSQMRRTLLSAWALGATQTACPVCEGEMLEQGYAGCSALANSWLSRKCFSRPLIFHTANIWMCLEPCVMCSAFAW